MPLRCSDMGLGAWLPNLALGTGRPRAWLDVGHRLVRQAPGTPSAPCSAVCETLGLQPPFLSVR